MERVAGWIDVLSVLAGKLAGWLSVLLMLVTIEEVIAHNVFNAGSVGMQELAWHCFGAIFLLGMAVTLKEDSHVRVDILYTKLSDKGRAWVNLLGYSFFLIPTCVVIVFYGFDFAMQALDYGNSRPVDYYAKTWFGEGTGYDLLASVEGLLRSTILRGEMSPDGGGLEARWIIKSLIPLGFCLLAMQGIAEWLRCLATLLGRPTAPTAPEGPDVHAQSPEGCA